MSAQERIKLTRRTFLKQVGAGVAAMMASQMLPVSVWADGFPPFTRHGACPFSHSMFGFRVWIFTTKGMKRTKGFFTHFWLGRK